MNTIKKDRAIKNVAIYISIFLLTVIALILLMWNRVFITVQSGEAGVLFKRWSGTVVDRVYPEGFWTIFPWDSMTKYNLRIQEQRHEFDVLSKQGLTIHIKISIRFRPDPNMIGVLHQKIGPNYIPYVLIPEVEAVIRRFFGQFNDEEIYTSKKAILEKIINDSTDQLSDKFIILDDLIVRKIEFPKTVQDAIQSKITQYHKFKEYEYRIEREKLEAERKVIEANGIDKYKRIISKDLTDDYLRWRGIEATNNLATSNNTKVIVIGSGKDGLPIILNPDTK
jgi:regulator of protease activity HflC (stomatin/prohibitin superfamily)